MVSLDGTTSYRGHEFIKLLNTGSSHLATESYVAEQIALGGTSTTDLTNYYDKPEVDALLLNELNKDNPQDITGTLRLGNISGNSKIILNAVSSTKDFYVNGDGEVNGSFLATAIDSSSFVQCNNVIVSDDVKTNIIDSNGISDITLKRNTFDICYLKNGSLELSAGIDLVAPAQVQANTYNSFDDSSVLLLRNGNEFIRFRKVEDDILISKNIVANDLTINNIFTNSLHGDYLYADSFRCRSYTADTPFLGANLTQDGRITFMTYRHLTEDIRMLRDITVDDGKKISSNSYDSNGITNLVIERGGVMYMNFLDDRISIATGTMLVGDVITANSLHGDDCFANRFRVRHMTSDLTFDGANSTEDGRTTFMIFRHIDEDIRILKDVLLDNGAELNAGVINCSSLVSDICYGDSFRCKNNNTNTNFYGANKTQDGKVIYMVYRHIEEDIRFLYDLLIDNGKIISCNSFNSNGNVDITFQRNGIDYLYLTTLAEDKRVVCPNEIDFICQAQIKANNLNSNGNNDVSFKRNGVEYFKFTKSTISQDPFVLLGDTVDISSRKCFANEFSNRSYGMDTIFYGSNTTNDGRVEYMRYNKTSESLDLNCVFDNTGLNVIGNIIDTIVSDERLKENIEVIHANFTDCIKNVEVKKFNYKDEKYKNNDTFGFIAQELLKELPPECKGIVKKNKETHSDKTYLSINYMKLSVVLWKALQEEIDKREHIESRLFEVEILLKILLNLSLKQKLNLKLKNKNIK